MSKIEKIELFFKFDIGDNKKGSVKEFSEVEARSLCRQGALIADSSHKAKAKEGKEEADKLAKKEEADKLAKKEEADKLAKKEEADKLAKKEEADKLAEANKKK